MLTCSVRVELLFCAGLRSRRVVLFSQGQAFDRAIGGPRGSATARRDMQLGRQLSAGSAEGPAGLGCYRV